VLERELLRDAWPWFSAIVSSGTQNNDRSLIYLGQTARERFTRVLQIRDRLHFAAKGEPTRARGDEVVFQLETLLMFLSAAFDAAARVAHVVYFGSDYSSAGWRRERWRERLRQVEPVLAALADDGTHGGATLQMVGALRNTIHGEGLRSGEFRESGQRPAQLVRVTEKEGERLTRLLEHIGADPGVWGLEERRDEVWLAADRFVEALVPQATALLNQLMAKTEGACRGQLVPPLPGPSMIPHPNGGVTCSALRSGSGSGGSAACRDGSGTPTGRSTRLLRPRGIGNEVRPRLRPEPAAGL
jgi:hypothetical protein